MTPATVTHEQLRAAYDALGLEPELWDFTVSVTMGPDGVDVQRYVPGGPNGGPKWVRVGGELEPLLEHDVIPLERDHGA